jgi:protein-disulfide isomerase
MGKLLARASRLLDRAAAISIVVASVAITFAILSDSWSRPASVPIESGRGGQDVAEPGATELTTIANATTKGHPAAKLVIVEFSDFQCPACGHYARDTFGGLLREFVETGKVLYVFRNFPLETIHPFAFKAAEAAECAREQGKYWEMHDRLFANQRALAQPDLVAHARALGLDETRFLACLAGGMTHKVRQDIAEGSRLGVRSTPTFLVGQTEADGSIKIRGRITGAQPLSGFQAALERFMATSPPTQQ